LKPMEASNVGLLCVDQIGHLSFDDKSADLLYEVIGRSKSRMKSSLTPVIVYFEEQL
jgi:DNA replication protein DnaC